MTVVLLTATLVAPLLLLALMLAMERVQGALGGDVPTAREVASPDPTGRLDPWPAQLSTDTRPAISLASSAST